MRTVSVPYRPYLNNQPWLFRSSNHLLIWSPGISRRSKQQGISMTIGKPFKKGQSGNPGGRPKVVAEVKELARAHTGEAIKTLVSIMTNPKSAPAARVSAANSLLDRGYGKPPQHQHITGADGPQYVVRLPVVCETVEEWVSQCGGSIANGQSGTS